jgi:hypothetical protein
MEEPWRLRRIPACLKPSALHNVGFGETYRVGNPD